MGSKGDGEETDSVLHLLAYACILFVFHPLDPEIFS